MWGRAPSQACPERSRRVPQSAARRAPPRLWAWFRFSRAEFLSGLKADKSAALQWIFEPGVHRSETRVMPVITSWTQGAWVALDILLVALLIYQVLVMIRGTRAVPMLVGLLVVAVTFY